MATRYIVVGETTYRAIAEVSDLPVRSTGTRRPDGRWRVPIADDTWAELQNQRLTGESDEDVILRLIHKHHGRPFN